VTTQVISGGEKLKAALEKISKRVAKRRTLSVGWLETERYPDSGMQVAAVAAIQEFGAPRASIPARPFFRPMIAKHSDEWGPLLGKALKVYGYDVDKALNALGLTVSEELQQSIMAVNSPPLSPITLMLRKMRSQDQSLIVTGKTVGEAAARVAAGESTEGVNTKPLQDTGQLVRSIGQIIE